MNDSDQQDDPCDDIVQGPDWFDWFDKKDEKNSNPLESK